jgi:hypothetical protein
MRLLLLLAVCVLPLAFAGCAGYKLGPTGGQIAGAKSIQIAPFQNQTLEPRLTTYVSSALRKQVQQDATFLLETRGHPDVIVTGTIIRFDRGELAFEPGDVLTVRDYFLSLTAQIVAMDRVTGRTNLNQLVTGHTTIRVGADLATAERQAIPLLAADLARNALPLLVDGGW